MTIINTQLIPEFQYYFNQYVKNSIVNKYGVPLPVTVDQIHLVKGSFIELLFNDTFPYDTYTYLYESIDITSWPILTRQRLMIYSGSKYLKPSSSASTNFFNLQEHDHLLLGALLQYRHDSTSVIIIDTTSSVNVYIDGITTIVAVDIEELQTSLSKLIYFYLKLKIDNDIGYYNNINTITDGTMLSTCFELKLIDEYFQYITSNNVNFVI